MDDDLNWHRHIDNIFSGVRKLIHVMKKLRHTAKRNILLMVYQALCNSVISYGTNNTSLQKHAQRTVLKVMALT